MPEDKQGFLNSLLQQMARPSREDVGGPGVPDGPDKLTGEEEEWMQAELAWTKNLLENETNIPYDTTFKDGDAEKIEAERTHRVLQKILEEEYAARALFGISQTRPLF